MKRYIIMLLSLLAVTTGALAQSEMEITGKVTDPTGEELIGVSVVVKDVKGLGVITDIEGNYKIKVRQYQTLVFSYIGYKPQEVLVKGDRQVINVTLEEDTKNAVDEVVVTGMGTQKKLTVTGCSVKSCVSSCTRSCLLVRRCIFVLLAAAFTLAACALWLLVGLGIVEVEMLRGYVTLFHDFCHVDYRLPLSRLGIVQVNLALHSLLHRFGIVDASITLLSLFQKLRGYFSFKVTNYSANVVSSAE